MFLNITFERKKDKKCSFETIPFVSKEWQSEKWPRTSWRDFIFSTLQVAKMARDRENERGTKIVLGCKGLSSSISTRKMNSALCVSESKLSGVPRSRIVSPRGIKDFFVRMNESEYRRATRPMTLHSLTGTGIYFPSLKHWFKWHNNWAWIFNSSWWLNKVSLRFF